jgi:hypothetical protein
MRKLLLVVLVLAAFASCKKDKECNDQVKVMLYTNAQMIVNCGPFNVDVYVDDKLVGTLENPYSDKEVSIPCDVKDENGRILAVEIEQGKHKYKAVGDCGTNMVCSDEFNVANNDCQSVFIDFNN